MLGFQPYRHSGNIKADIDAKSALQFEVATFEIPFTDLKCFIKFYTNLFWDFCDRNKLNCIQNKVNKPYNLSLKRQAEVIISRIRIGHQNLRIRTSFRGSNSRNAYFVTAL